MSLIVSLRVPDGIVVAADSLSTAQNLLQYVAEDLEIECPKCKKTISKQGIQLPPIPVPFNASSFTQKLFSLNKVFALSIFGQGIINEKSIYYHVKQFENSVSNILEIVSIRDRFIKYLEKELSVQFPKYKEEAPENFYPVGFHINGFEKINEESFGVTYEVFIGHKNLLKKHVDIGCSIGGELRVVQKLWEIGKTDPRLQFKYKLFSLQDAIDFCKYLISATSSFQRFANEVATVGGEIDIALLTPFHDFQWIKRKELMKVLEK